MLEDVMGHRWDGTRINNTGLTEITERNEWNAVHGDELDRRGDALRAAGSEVRPGS